MGIIRTIRDPVFGDLFFVPSHRVWRSKILFTPKHPIAVSLHDPASRIGLERVEEELAAVRSAYLFHRQREWDHRLSVATFLLGHGIGLAVSAADVARRLRLREVVAYLDGTGGWFFSLPRWGEASLSAVVELSADAVIDVHF